MNWSPRGPIRRCLSPPSGSGVVAILPGSDSIPDGRIPLVPPVGGATVLDLLGVFNDRPVVFRTPSVFCSPFSLFSVLLIPILRTPKFYLLPNKNGSDASPDEDPFTDDLTQSEESKL